MPRQLIAAIMIMSRRWSTTVENPMMIGSIAGASLQWTVGVLRLRSDSPGLPGQSGLATEC